MLTPGRIKKGKCIHCYVAEKEATCPGCENMVGNVVKVHQCEECQKWYHAQWDRVGEAGYRKPQKKEEEPWYCRKCMQHIQRYMES